MERRPKKNARTGSKLLGAELKRLRGGRRLQDIAQLSRKPPFSKHVKPISQATLSQLETGTTMPTLASLYTVSMLYRVSVNQLMGFIVEDSLAPADEALASAVDLAPEFARRLRRGEWHQALPLALHGERTATTERSRIGWRANRALCLSKMGLHDEAVAMLSSCAESRAIDGRQRMQILQDLAEIHAAAGYLTMAAMTARQALELSNGLDLRPIDTAYLQQTRAALLVDAHWHGLDREEKPLHEALRLVESAAKSVPVEDVVQHLWLAQIRAVALHCLGNNLVAAKELADAIVRARAASCALAEIYARRALAHVRIRQGKKAEAESLLGEAVELATKEQQVEALFDVSFDLFKLLRPARPTVAVKHFRRCKELFPLIVSRTPLVLEFEQFCRDVA